MYNDAHFPFTGLLTGMWKASRPDYLYGERQWRKWLKGRRVLVNFAQCVKSPIKDIL